MKFKHAFCFLSLIFVTLLSCKKDLDDQLFIENSATVERNLAQLESQQQRDFFDRYFLTSNNPHILPSLQGRNGEDSLINAVYEYVLNLELESGVVEGLVDAVGFPVWNHSTIVEEVGNPNYKVVLTPFARLDEDHISGYAASFPHGWGSATSSEFYILIFERSKIKSNVLANHPHEDSLALGFHVATHYNFDEELFGTVDSDFTTWMSMFPPEDGDGFNDGISSRNNYVTLWGLIHCHTFGPPNGGVEERSGCYDFYSWSSYVPCEPGKNNGNSGSGSGIGNFINNEGGGGSGPNNTIILSNYIQDCQAILAAQEPGGVPPSNIENADNPAMIQQCENYFAVSDGLNLSEEELLWLINEGMLGTIAFMLDNEEINQDAILAWIEHKRGEGPHLSMRRFEALFEFLTVVLVPELSLTNVEVEFLLDNTDFLEKIYSLWEVVNTNFSTPLINIIHEEISDFINAVMNSPNQKTYALEIIESLLSAGELYPEIFPDLTELFCCHQIKLKNKLDFSTSTDQEKINYYMYAWKMATGANCQIGYNGIDWSANVFTNFGAGCLGLGCTFEGNARLPGGMTLPVILDYYTFYNQTETTYNANPETEINGTSYIRYEVYNWQGSIKALTITILNNSQLSNFHNHYMGCP